MYLSLGSQNSIFSHAMDLGYTLGNHLDLEHVFRSMKIRDPPVTAMICQLLTNNSLLHAKVLKEAHLMSYPNFPVFLDHCTFIIPTVLHPDLSDACLVAAATARLDILIGGKTGSPSLRHVTS